MGSSCRKVRVARTPKTRRCRKATNEVCGGVEALRLVASKNGVLEEQGADVVSCAN